MAFEGGGPRSLGGEQDLCRTCCPQPRCWGMLEEMTRVTFVIFTRMLRGVTGCVSAAVPTVFSVFSVSIRSLSQFSSCLSPSLLSSLFSIGFRLSLLKKAGVSAFPAAAATSSPAPGAPHSPGALLNSRLLILPGNALTSNAQALAAWALVAFSEAARPYQTLCRFSFTPREYGGLLGCTALVAGGVLL